MSWTAILVLSAGSYVLKAIGPMLVGDRTLSAELSRLLALVAVPLFAALIVVQTFGDGRSLTLDARVPAIAVAGLLVWRRASFLVVMVAAAAVAAGWRAVVG